MLVEDLAALANSGLDAIYCVEAGRFHAEDDEKAFKARDFVARMFAEKMRELPEFPAGWAFSGGIGPFMVLHKDTLVLQDLGERDR